MVDYLPIIKSPQISRIKKRLHRFFFDLKKIRVILLKIRVIRGLFFPTCPGAVVAVFATTIDELQSPWLPRKQPRCSHATQRFDFGFSISDFGLGLAVGYWSLGIQWSLGIWALDIFSSLIPNSGFGIRHSLFSPICLFTTCLLLYFFCYRVQYAVDESGAVR